ncbi:hypothetical protein [Agromyces sp. NPDC056965]|uniref:hypothetical protein n=1 Tax=Agromyces sp. NPDC056965 TaxID=3345983 RepID=UPI0036359322
MKTADVSVPMAWMVRRADLITLVTCIGIITLFSVGLLRLALDGHPLSVIDEHIHFDYAVRVSQGELPWRGAVLGPQLLHEWACGVGHEGGGLPYACGDPRLSIDDIPSGKLSSGYGHYPTFFLGAAATEAVLAWTTGLSDPLTAFRVFSALTMILGVVSCAIFGWLIGLRTWGLIAATVVPVAASMIVFAGTIVNPSSTAILTGSLIAGTGILWMQRGRGFVWLALAAAFSAMIAVTDSLAVGGFGLAMLIAIVGPRFGLVADEVWRPKWWQLLVLIAVTVAPIVAWGQYIRVTATVPNSALYGFIPPAGRKDILIGAAQELATLHTPWRETGGIWADPVGLVPRLLNGVSFGIPLWITVLVIGGLVMAVGRRWLEFSRSKRPDLTDDVKRGRVSLMDPTLLLAVGTLMTLVLYPPALRISNWITFGFNFGVVDRYSNNLAPLLVLLALLLLKNSWYARILAILGSVGAIGVVAAGL